jgi:D-amino-acid oxidase
MIGRMSTRVTVVGAGVVGLSCAVRLAEAGLGVDVLARDLPSETTSSIAGALWLPYRAEPADAVARWARATHAELSALAASDTGVRRMPGFLLDGGPGSEPAWLADLADLVALTPCEDPAPGYARGWATTLPLVDMGRYLPYLRARLEAAGGTLTRLPLACLPPRGLVVNCTGLAARALAPDPTVHPVRGQVVVVEDPGLTHWWCDEQEVGGRLRYVLPRGREVVLGGTAQEDSWDLTPDPAEADRIVADAVSLVPALRGARVLAHRVGLRPARPGVRLDVEQRPSQDDPRHVVVHCYGHGGSGVTLSWGCADDVLAEVGALVA